MGTKSEHTRYVKEAARKLGFLDCGVVQAGYLAEDARRLRSWLDAGYQAGMSYMTAHPGIRTDPSGLVEGARSVVVVLQNYYTKEKQSDPAAPVISKYAYGRDYHRVMRKKLKVLLERMKEITGGAKGRIFIDSGPLLERALGRLAGLGWIGRNSMLISRKSGSFFFIGSIITDCELDYDRPISEYCGNCTRCIDACPTGAIIADKTVDAGRCISYHTVENKDETLPSNLKGRFMKRVFGCDICQDVCPWNHKAPEHDEPGLKANSILLSMTREDWYGIDQLAFERIFSGSAVKRTRFSGLRRNLDFIMDG